MALKVGDLIPIGGSGNVKASEVLEGKRFSSDEGTDLVGTMKNRGNLVVSTSVNDKDYGQGYFNNVKLKGLGNESEGTIQNIIKDVINKKGKGFNEAIVKNLLPNVKDKLSDIIKQVDPNFSIKPHVSIEYKYNCEKWFRHEIPFNEKININSCLVLLTITHGAHYNSAFLISMNELVKKYKHGTRNFCYYNESEWDNILSCDPDIQIRVAQTSELMKDLRFYLREKNERYTELFFHIHEDKLIYGTSENSSKPISDYFRLKIDICEI